MPILQAKHNWTDVLAGRPREQLETLILPAYLRECRWFGGKARQMKRLEIVESIPVGDPLRLVQILLMRVTYADGGAEIYVLPLGCAKDVAADQIAGNFPQAVVSPIELDGRRAIIYDGVYSESFCTDLLSSIVQSRTIRGRHGSLQAYPGRALSNKAEEAADFPTPKVLKAEQTNTAVLFGEELFLKLYRHPEQGINPDLEIVSFLTEVVPFPNIPSFAGALEYRGADEEPISIGILQSFVPNRGDSWSYFLDAVKYYYRGVGASGVKAPTPSAAISFLELSQRPVPPSHVELISEQALDLAGLLGTRTAELHKALAAATDHPSFKPEPFSRPFQMSVFGSMAELVRRVLRLLESNLCKLSAGVQEEAQQLLGREHQVMEKLRAFVDRDLSAMRIRIHGDYHLGQVLYTGKDFIIIDFEGEPARSLPERRIKQSALKDAAGMVRSFHYAAYLSLLTAADPDYKKISDLVPWADLWYYYMGAAFLKSYLDVIDGSGIVPVDYLQTEIMLKAFLLEKAVYELGYELNNRPGWVPVPLRGIRYLLNDE
ncbi:MAG: putative maltokinase [Desulforhabdus sp.]|jgi:maltose alpha-D-glucosyltransferase/alpha-amylase|nr:putative maltokinase [Desulforhabdus sp.]